MNNILKIYDESSDEIESEEEDISYLDNTQYNKQVINYLKQETEAFTEKYRCRLNNIFITKLHEKLDKSEKRMLLLINL
jgi:ABC-type lipopolysaccharide export system ATPase subunit